MMCMEHGVSTSSIDQSLMTAVGFGPTKFRAMCEKPNRTAVPLPFWLCCLFLFRISSTIRNYNSCHGIPTIVIERIGKPSLFHRRAACISVFQSVALPNTSSDAAQPSRSTDERTSSILATVGAKFHCSEAAGIEENAR